MIKNSVIIGIGLMVLGSAFLSGKDGLVKSFLHQINPFQIIWMQFAGTFMVMAFIAFPMHGLRVFQPRPLVGQFLRGAMNICAVASLYWALTYIPLADATAMLLFAPAVATILSPVVLGEKIGVLRITAVLVGFCGVLIILRPGFSGDQVGYYIGLMAGVLLGGYFLANRRLAGSQPIILEITHNALMGAVALSPLVPLIWHPVPEVLTWTLVIGLGMAIIGQGAMIASFRWGPAAVISPYSYTMLIFAAFIGYFTFDTIPDVFSWTGISLIVGSGIYIAHRERKTTGA